MTLDSFCSNILRPNFQIRSLGNLLLPLRPKTRPLDSLAFTASPTVAAPFVAPVVAAPVNQDIAKRTICTLRVIRIIDGAHPRVGGGRIIISGRMIDVCAELDRMASAEAGSGTDKSRHSTTAGNIFHHMPN